MREQFINIRVESVSTEKNAELIKHCLRAKKEIRAINDNENSYIDSDSNRVIFSRNDYKTEYNNVFKVITKKLLDQNKKLIDKQKNILKKHGKYLNKKRTNQTLSGVITFSDSIQNITPEKMIEIEEAAYKTVKEICSKYNTDLHYLVLHTDELGLPHFHFSVDNFDNETGLTFNKSKGFGSDLQDIAAKYFSRFGFNRGIKKENNFNRKHLSIEEFKEYQDTKKANKKLIEQNKTLIQDNKELQSKLNNANSAYSKILEEFMVLINDIEEFSKEEDQAKKTKKWLELFKRYTNSDNTTKREQLMKKVSKVRDKVIKAKKAQM